MKKRFVVILASVALLGAGIAVAVGTWGGDAMISKSYYENTYLPQLRQALSKQAEKVADPTLQSALKRLETLKDQQLQTLKDRQDSPLGYTPVQMAAGDALELKTGASLLLYSGAGKLTAGTLADVTSGTAVSAGGALDPHHRYIVTSPQGAAVTQLQQGELGYQGESAVKRNAGTGSGTDIGIPGTDTSLPFTDVGTGQWYYSAVDFVYRRGYFSGTGANTFAPNAFMDRAMVATVLYRLSGDSASDLTPAFSDVPAGEWYTEGVAWASAKGVVNGMGDGLYAPHLAVTREQLVTMLYRYEKDYKRAGVPITGELSAFPDNDRISAWARDAMGWAVGAGLLHGRDSGHLDPTGTATRAEVAAILQRFSNRS